MTTKEITAKFAGDNIGRDLNVISNPAPGGNLVETLSLWERLALVSGILFVALQLSAMIYFITLVFPRMGPPEAVEQHLAFYRQHGEVLRLGNYLLVLPTPFFLLFLGGLSGILRRAEDGKGGLTTTAITSGAIVAILWPLSAVLNNIGIDIAQSGGDRATIVALDAVGPYMLALSALPRATLLAATATVLLYRQLAPRWVGWIGLGLGVISVIGSATLVLAALFPVLALSTLLFELWILVLSVTLLQKFRTVGSTL